MCRLISGGEFFTWLLLVHVWTGSFLLFLRHNWLWWSYLKIRRGGAWSDLGSRNYPYDLCKRSDESRDKRLREYSKATEGKTAVLYIFFSQLDYAFFSTIEWEEDGKVIGELIKADLSMENWFNNINKKRRCRKRRRFSTKTNSDPIYVVSPRGNIRIIS